MRLSFYRRAHKGLRPIPGAPGRFRLGRLGDTTTNYGGVLIVGFLLYLAISAAREDR